MNTVKVIDYIVRWLNDYCEIAGLDGFVVGVSGGVDSAVTSTLCAQTGKKVLALILPIRQTGEQVSLAERHVVWLEEKFPHVQNARLDLTPLLDAAEASFPTEIQDGLVMANTRSRLRMTALYAYASRYRLLVAGTGNKVEDFGVGFFTKYGDGGVDLSPIADLMKSEVYSLGRELEILEDILRATPTDGLWEDNRSDELQIGATYDELEWAMEFDKDAGTGQTLSFRQREVLAIYRKFHGANRHKMESIPVCRIPDSLR